MQVEPVLWHEWVDISVRVLTAFLVARFCASELPVHECQCGQTRITAIECTHVRTDRLKAFVIASTFVLVVGCACSLCIGAIKEIVD